MRPPAKPPSQSRAVAGRQPVRSLVVNRQAKPQTNAQGRAANNARPPAYAVQAPIHLAAQSQQIRATLGGTQHVAGSVDISSAGGGKIYISNLRVDQQHRRQGVAARLIDAAIATARRQGFRSATLEARPSDNGISPQALVAMYRRHGFKSVGKTGRGSPLMERRW